MKKRPNIICWIIAPLLIISFSILFKSSGKTFAIYSNQIVKTKQAEDNKYISTNLNQRGKDVEVNLLELGVNPIPIKDSKEIMIYPGGAPIGVKLNTKGVLVVALSDIEGVKGKIQSPAASAGIQIGDSIIKINDIEINSAEEVTRFVNREKNSELTLKIQRKNNTDYFEAKVKPVVDSNDGKQKIGLWVRDSTAGVGTLTFYD
ncbi:MAG: PDZ domain-containing protein, partial [Clostridiaceae bacterium]|nr:PDZ domain-containing protein [Clostridiaceae bacterium]